MTQNVGCIVTGLVFGVFLPIVSIIIELEIVGEWMDSFEVLYTYLRFPTYWSIGLVQLTIIGWKSSVKDDEENETERIE